MSEIKCELFCRSNTNMLPLIYTGFSLLAEQGKIELSYHIGRNQRTDLPDCSSAELLVRLNGAKLLLFDMLDFGGVKKELIDQVDVCFKRSFSSGILGSELAYRKVFPLGLAWRVYEKYPSRFSLHRATLAGSAGEAARSFIWTLPGPGSSLHNRLFRLHIDNCSAKPDPSLPAGVIFMAAVWDPLMTKPKYRPAREAINLMRADCIRKLRREFGSRFMGGLSHDEYSSRHFADCLIQDNRLSEFGSYMRLMRQHPIGVATTGLHDSIGFKFAEYLAFSRAVVSERLRFEAPGLEAGKHYLEFTTADECVEAVSTLMDDKELRTQMTEKNHEYYQTYLRPDRLVWNALSVALGDSGNTSRESPISHQTRPSGCSSDPGRPVWIKDVPKEDSRR